MPRGVCYAGSGSMLTKNLFWQKPCPAAFYLNTIIEHEQVQCTPSVNIQTHKVFLCGLYFHLLVTFSTHCRYKYVVGKGVGEKLKCVQADDRSCKTEAIKDMMTSMYPVWKIETQRSTTAPIPHYRSRRSDTAIKTDHIGLERQHSFAVNII